jgi:chitinase
MGMPFYNYEWTAVPANNNGLFQPGTANQNNGGYALTKSMENTAGYTLYRDTTTQEPWLFNSATGDFWTFDDPTSLAFKTNYVVNKKLGGVMFWELSSDDANATLLKSMTNVLK